MDSTSIGTKYSATKNHSYDYHPSAQGDTFVSKRSTRDCAKIFEQWNPIAVIDIPFLMERMSSARMMNRFLLLHYLILSFMIASANTTSITTDQQALLSLKGHVTHDPANFLARNWNTSSPVCNWTGVTCDVRTHRVTALNISGLNLTGTIPSELGNLSSLQTLDLSFNWFSGSIPASIFNMSSLLSIRFTNNTLFGELPPNFCNHLSNLEYLFLKSNMFHGKIPSTLSNCKRLRNISLSLNDFSGTIPKEIGNVTTLIGLHLRGNKLQGEIPEELGNLAELEELWLQNNFLTGTIPSSIFNLSSLSNLDLSVNNLTGEIPEELGNLAELEKLQLQNNFLTGTIPPSIFNLSSLSDLELSFNSLTGVIPHEIDNLHNLEWMIFSFNKLVGVVPTTIFNVSTLKFLYLGSNSFFGRLPSSADVRLPNLEELSLSGNNFSGTIPSFIFNTSKLSTLELQRNSFSGFIPNTFGNLRNLKWLDLGDNYLTSSTSELSFLSSSNCKYLEYFSISNNPLGGILPRVIANQRRFTYLELFQATNGFSENNLIGRGGFGFVYKARIQDGMEVAVKVFDLQYGRAIKSFDIECGMIKRIRHRNIIKFISSCSSDDFKALVLEYMPYGSLEKCLYSSNYILDIFQRLNIMIDVASALEYLHFGYSVPIIHCDLKPNNVLLDDNMVAHLSDFGMAKPFLKEDQSLTQTQTLATIGYMAPEYGREGRVSTNGDVYSFGIMLMETFTRKKPTDESFTGEMTLKRWVNDLLLISIMEVVDANLLSHEDKHFVAKEQCMSFVFNLAMKCTIESPEERINAKEIVTKLAG
ncbi:protein kinase domain-containing protein [Citrus sinensis]|uniref:Protein kinase domain-containing protein n=2 Tax=Citrus sinensis TaxID=2711 RepID=A0ACB8JH92_CITSI|nr:protein kinase domain-containing protein [Citrus sinensis]KAH9716290.1 protein kinase domain-containing protein [Citrus sinensis]